MRKLFWQINISLDGFMEGPNHELDDLPTMPDPAFDAYGFAMLSSIDDIILGRKTYDLFASYWPTATTPDAAILNTLPKLVFSNTLASSPWNNTRIATRPLLDEITALKQKPGNDIALFGSANLAATLMQHNLIDEYRILISPLLLGRGNPAFPPSQPRISLKLTRSETWPSGITLLFYNT